MIIYSLVKIILNTNLSFARFGSHSRFWCPVYRLLAAVLAQGAVWYVSTPTLWTEKALFIYTEKYHNALTKKNLKVQTKEQAWVTAASQDAGENT